MEDSGAVLHPVSAEVPQVRGVRTGLRRIEVRHGGESNAIGRMRTGGGACPGGWARCEDRCAHWLRNGRVGCAMPR